MSDEPKTVEEIREIVARVSCLDFRFLVRLDDTRPYLQVEYEEADISSGQEATQRGRKWMLSPYMTYSEIVQTCFLATIQSYEHRVREAFKYAPSAEEGPRAIYSPHWDADSLWSFAGKAAFKDMRAAQWVQPEEHLGQKVSVLGRVGYYAGESATAIYVKWDDDHTEAVPAESVEFIEQ